MKKYISLFVVISFIFLLAVSCSNKDGKTDAGTTQTSTTQSEPTTTSSNDNNNNNNDDCYPPGTPNNIHHLDGTWDYDAGSWSGTMTFSNGEVTEFTNSKCNNQLIRANVWVYTNEEYDVKIRNYAWCTDTSQLLKFAMNFTDDCKDKLSGIVDLHYEYQTNPGAYKRYNITMTKRK